jgi:methionyl-tRNA formyltransferase
MQPDLLVVAAYGQILSRDVLLLPTRGTINVHASLLPKYRGAAPVAYAILKGESRTGVTIIKVTPGLDSGDMIAQEATAILPDDTTGSLEARLAQIGAKLAVEVARRYAAGAAIAGAKQDRALVTKAPKIDKEFGLIDWAKPAEEIARHVRAMQPWPTAYTFLHRPGKEPMRAIVNRATAEGQSGIDFDVPPSPGSLHSPTTSGKSTSLWAATGSGVLAIHELQPAGKKRMAAEEFLRGHPIVEGMRFGPEVLA